MLPALYYFKRYTLAEPDDYLKVVVTYDEGVVIQDLVQLLHKRRISRHPMRLPRLTHIHYENPLDIPSLVAPQLVTARSDLRADAPTFVPRGGHTSQMEAAEELRVEGPLPEEPEAEPVDEVYEEPQDLPPVTNEPALIRVHEPTEEEISAAGAIQAAYRAYVKCREAQAHAVGRGLKAQTNTVFIACLKNVYAFNWKQNTYRTLYLWALPHLVVCLDKAIAIAHETKVKTKGLLLKESHERLEELIKRTTHVK